MSVAPSDAGSPRRPLRLWPGVVIVVLQWLIRFGLPVVAPEASMWAILGGLAGGVALVVWWLFFSRAPWSERLGGLALMAVGVAATPLILHESIATGGMGMLFYLYVVPPLCLAFVAWAALGRRLATGPRWAAMAAAIAVACGGWALVRTGGFDGYGDSDFAWRWSMTEEERLLARLEGEPLPEAAAGTAGAAAGAAEGPAAGESAGEAGGADGTQRSGAAAAGPGGDLDAVPPETTGGARTAGAGNPDDDAGTPAGPTGTGADPDAASTRGAASPPGAGPDPAAAALTGTATPPGAGSGAEGAPAADAAPAATAPGAAPAGVARPTGPASAAPRATASSAPPASPPTGTPRRRSSSGAVRSARAGRRSRSAAAGSTPRSSAARRR